MKCPAIFSRPLRDQRVAPDHRTPRCRLVSQNTVSLCSKCSLLTILYPPMEKKYVSLLFFILSHRFSCFAFSSPLTPPCGFHVTFLKSPPLILMYKMSCKTVILQSIFLIHGDFWFLAIVSSTQINSKKLCKFRHFSCQHFYDVLE